MKLVCKLKGHDPISVRLKPSDIGGAFTIQVTLVTCRRCGKVL